MREQAIATLVLDGDIIDVIHGRTSDQQPCAIAHFNGQDGWGVTMNIRTEELDTFLESPAHQRAFVTFAKIKLGMEAACNTPQ